MGLDIFIRVSYKFITTNINKPDLNHRLQFTFSSAQIIYKFVKMCFSGLQQIIHIKKVNHILMP